MYFYPRAGSIFLSLVILLPALNDFSDYNFLFLIFAVLTVLVTILSFIKPSLGGRLFIALAMIYLLVTYDKLWFLNVISSSFLMLALGLLFLFEDRIGRVFSECKKQPVGTDKYQRLSSSRR